MTHPYSPDHNYSSLKMSNNCMSLVCEGVESTFPEYHYSSTLIRIKESVTDILLGHIPRENRSYFNSVPYFQNVCLRRYHKNILQITKLLGEKLLEI